MTLFVFFSSGNLKSLKTIPEEKGINVYGKLRDFFNRHYTAQYMTLAVHSKRMLKSIQIDVLSITMI